MESSCIILPWNVWYVAMLPLTSAEIGYGTDMRMRSKYKFTTLYLIIDANYLYRKWDKSKNDITT